MIRCTLEKLLGQKRRSSTAVTARERLTLVIAHERYDSSQNTLFPLIQAEILQLLRNRLGVDGGQASVTFARADGADILHVEVTIPQP